METQLDSDPSPAVAELQAQPNPHPHSGIRFARRALKVAFFIGLPLLLLPALLPRKVVARKLSGAEAAAPGSTSGASHLEREKRLQTLVDEFKTRMAINEQVVVSIVDRNELVVSVERARNGVGGFFLSIEEGFLEGLTGDELDAVLAHELGHVWIFTHHPYLQTEELANQIAMQVVSQDTLAAVYDKVWKRTGGRKGNVVYLPAIGTTTGNPR
jgi:hypothetical protein